jgi:hypothetical protein
MTSHELFVFFGKEGYAKSSFTLMQKWNKKIMLIQKIKMLWVVAMHNSRVWFLATFKFITP